MGAPKQAIVMIPDPTAPPGRTGPWEIGAPPMRHETHYDDRIVRCFVDRAFTLPAMFEDAVRRHSDGEALVCGQTRLTWAQLDRAVSARAAALGRRGIEPGDRVALLLPNGLDFPMTLLAIAKLGAVGVPLSARNKRSEVQFILNHCEAAAVVFAASLASELPRDIDVPMLRIRLAVESWPVTLSSDTPSTTPAPTISEDDVALIMYTSGTTGHPKGAMVSHLNLVHVAHLYAYCMNLSAADRSLVAVPLSHITGIAAHLMTTIRCASTLIVLETFKAPDFLALAARERMTHTVLVPAMYSLCLQDERLSSHDLSAWRVGGYGGAPMPAATIAALTERLPALSLMNCYGATETVAPIAMMPPGETAQHRARVGRAIPGSQVLVVDEQGREAPADTPGELWMAGPTVVRGYWNDPEATRASFTSGFWHSGDIGSMTSEGLIGVHDRKKDMINRGGYKVFAIEVENVLCEHPAVVEAAIVAKPCPVLGERVHAFVTLRPGTLESAHASVEAELRALTADRLADFKVPESFTLSASPLPRNANGKVLKRDLREQVSAVAAHP